MFRYFLMAITILFQVSLANATSVELAISNTGLKNHCYTAFTTCVDKQAGFRLSLNDAPADSMLSPHLASRNELSLAVFNDFQRSYTTPSGIGSFRMTSRERVSVMRLNWGVEFLLPQSYLTPTVAVGLSVLRFNIADTVDYTDIRIEKTKTSTKPYLALGLQTRVTNGADLVARVVYADHSYSGFKLTKTTEVGVQYKF